METTPVTARIGASIRARGIDLGLSQADLSEQLGISRAKISAMENGRFGSSKLLEMVTLNDGKISLTPAYDVVPTAVWPEHDRELSLRIGGEVFLDNLHGEHLLAEASSWGMRRPLSTRLINQTLTALEKALPIVRQASIDEFWDHPLLGTVVSETRDRMEKLRIP